MKILVSACLLGENCKYNGKNNRNEQLIDYLKDYDVIPVCPEVLGGLSTPRIPCEIVNGIVTNREGVSCQKEFVSGAKKALEIAKENKVDFAILQSRSPSCGVKQVYSGNFDGTLIDGSGIFVSLLKEHNIEPIDVEDICEFFNKV